MKWLGLILMVFPLRALASPAPCIRTKVDDDVPNAHAFADQVELEAAALLRAYAAEPCAEIVLHKQASDRFTLRVSYAEQAREALLSLDDVQPSNYARVGAMVVASLLRELLDGARAATPREAAPEEPEATTFLQAAIDPEKPPFLQPRKDPDYGGAPWSLQTSFGGRFLLTHRPQLAHLELAAQRALLAPAWLRLTFALFGEFARVRAPSVRVTNASAGLRLGAEMAAVRTARTRLWVGPALEAQALLIATSVSDEPRATHNGRALLSAGLRASVVHALRRLRLLAALEIGGVLTPLAVHYEGQSPFYTPYAYAGAYAMLLLGVERDLVAAAFR